MQDSSEIRLQRALAAIRDRTVLQSRLDAIAERKRLEDARVGICIDGRMLTLVAGDDDAHRAGDVPVAAGCLAKLLTATLIGDAVAAGRIGWDDPVADPLARTAREREALSGVAVRHLLDHTHGLDAPEIAQAPLRDDGRIDVGRLCAAFDARPLIEPGRFYSYGHVGAWLGGALLETLHGLSYAAQLHAQGWTIEAPIGSDGAYCPAVGANLHLTIEQWLAFALRSIDTLQPDRDGMSCEVALPGWHPAERAIVRGWKSYGDGWLGHNGSLQDRSAALRINPRERIAIVVSAREPNGAIFAASGVFGDLLPEFRMLRPPRLLKQEETAALSLREHVGRYLQAKTAVDVTVDADGALHLSVRDRSTEAQVSPARRLRQADGGVFLSESGGNPEFMFVQFIAGNDAYAPEYLWNGRQMWRRGTSVAH